MKFLKLDYFFSFLILIISLLFVLGLFLSPGRPATFDSFSHIATIAQFSTIISKGEIPVVWMNSFANYGLPMGIFAQQVTSYLGGLITIITNNPTLTYNLLVLVGAFFTCIFFYLFLRLNFTAAASFLGAFLLNFTQYRIFDIYTRGALPEFFASIFLPLILICLHLIIVNKKGNFLLLLTLLIAGLALTHPMMLVAYSFLFIPYLLFLLITNNLNFRQKMKLFFASAFFMLLGLILCSYYYFPLTLELKYFYFGRMGHFNPDSFLSLFNYLDFKTYFFTNTEILTKGHVIQTGIIETLILIIGLCYSFYEKLFTKLKRNNGLLYFSLTIAILIIFFTSTYSYIFYQKLFFLNNIQFTWRLLSSLVFIPPIVLAFLYNRFSNKIVFILIIFLIALFSFPNLYGKNFTIYPNSAYFFSKENPQGIWMTTVWTGKTEDYPNKNPQGEIIAGEGKIISEELKNSSRTYVIDAQTPIRMVDRTFYFPGWTVLVDGVKTNIEFQNPDYRGVITYQVPPGKHSVYLSFEDTKVRLIGKILSVIAVGIFIVLLLFRKRVKQILV